MLEACNIARGTTGPRNGLEGNVGRKWRVPEQRKPPSTRCAREAYSRVARHLIFSRYAEAF
jgi:hypothetical protein